MYFDKLINLLSPPSDIDSISIKRNVERISNKIHIQYFSGKRGTVSLGAYRWRMFDMVVYCTRT
jgi:hypothetical protein